MIFVQESFATFRPFLFLSSLPQSRPLFPSLAVRSDRVMQQVAIPDVLVRIDPTQ